MRGGGSDVEKSALWFAVGVGVAAVVFAPHPKPGRRPRALTSGQLPSRDLAPDEQELGLAPKTLMSVTSKPVSDPLTASSSTSTVDAPIESIEAAEYMPEVSQAGPEHERPARNLRAANGRAEAPVLRAVIAEEEPEEEPLPRVEARSAAGNFAGLALVLPRGAVDLEEQSRQRQPGQGAFNMCGSSTTELALATFARRIRPQLPPSREPVFIDRDDDRYNIPLADNAFAPLPAQSGINAAVWVVLAVVLCLAAAVAYNLYDSRQQWAAIHDGLQQASQTQTYQSEQARQLDQRAWVGLAQTSLRPITETGGGFTVRIQNSGKTPASSVRVASIIELQKLDELTDVPASEERPQAEAGVLMPGGVVSVPVWFQSSPEAIEDLLAGKVRAVNYVTVTYTDIFKQQHTTRACFYWYGTLRTVQSCERFNSAD